MKITDIVEIEPTQRGWKIIKDLDIELRDGYPIFPLWLVMKWFGPHFILGQEKPFLEMSLVPSDSAAIICHVCGREYIPCDRCRELIEE